MRHDQGGREQEVEDELSSSAERALSAREDALAQREAWVRAREVALRLRAGRHADASDERDRLRAKLHDANARLIATMVHASEAARLAWEASALRTERRGEHKESFLAVLGHELRTPLSSIAMMLGVIAADSGDPHSREHGIIARCVDHLTRLVEDLLDLSRIGSGTLHLRREPVELAEVVARAVEVTRPMIEAARHTLTIEVAASGLVVVADLTRLMQAVANVLSNAARYTAPGGTIAITARRRNARIVLCVRDNGRGISKAMLPRIFDLFTQERSPGGALSAGLGIGLTIVQSVVELHGGTVTAHSEGVGLGSELVIELPAAPR